MSAEDLTPNAKAQLQPVASKLLREMDADLSGEDRLRLGYALAEAIKIGVRIGAAEVIGNVTTLLRDEGIELDLHLELIDPGELVTAQGTRRAAGQLPARRPARGGRTC